MYWRGEKTRGEISSISKSSLIFRKNSTFPMSFAILRGVIDLTFFEKKTVEMVDFITFCYEVPLLHMYTFTTITLIGPCLTQSRQNPVFLLDMGYIYPKDAVPKSAF